MSRRTFPHFSSFWAKPALFVLLCAFLFLIPGPARPEPLRSADEPTSKSPKTHPETYVEVRFTDNSVLKLAIREEKIDFQTQYGKLQIPLADIRKIEFGLRVPDEISRRVEAAVDDLGNQQYRRREAAGAILLGLREKAFPAVMKATKHQDMEIANRAEELIKKLQESVPADLLKSRDFDIIYTDNCKISGRIEPSALKANTTQFGEVSLRLSDVHILTSRGADVEADLANAAPAPTSMVNFQNEFGKTFVFKVTANSSGSLWGTDVYSADSTLATAVIHAGILQAGQTGVVKVTMMASPNVFVGSTRHGITSSSYQQYPSAYRLQK